MLLQEFRSLTGPLLAPCLSEHWLTALCYFQPELVNQWSPDTHTHSSRSCRHAPLQGLLIYHRSRTFYKPVHIILLYLTTLKVITKRLITHLSPVSYYFFLGHNTFLDILYSNSMCSSSNVKHQYSHPYRQTVNIRGILVTERAGTPFRKLILEGRKPEWRSGTFVLASVLRHVKWVHCHHGMRREETASRYGG
jgi:hypothetical protein